MEIQIQSNLFENNLGELTFQIEMVYRDQYSWSDFSCVIDLDYYAYPQFRTAVIDIACQDKALDNKLEIVQSIMSLVQTIEVINDCEVLDLIDDDELDVELILVKFFLDLAIQSSAEQAAPLAYFNRKLNLKNFVNCVEFDGN